ncbi:MFS monocarboxylate [Seiridium cupressi]
MASQAQTIELPARAADSPPDASESELTPAPGLPPVSRRKQAVVLASAFVATGLTIGYNQTFGVFQEYYLSPSQDVLVPSLASQATPPTALLAFVGTLCYGLTWAGGIIVNPIMSRIEHGTWKGITPSSGLWRRSITVFGVLLVAVGFTLASFSTTLWQLLLTQGLLVGLGMSFIYFPLLSPAPEYFTSHRATAMGFILAGGGTGGYWSANRMGSAAESAAGAQLPLAFIPSYTVVLGRSASTGANLLAAANVINAVSRILTGYAGDRLGRQNTLALTLFLAAASVFAFWLSSVLATASAPAFSLWLAFIVLYSFSGGGYYALFPALIAEVFGIRQYVAVNAFILLVRGLGTMFGSPVGGQLLADSEAGTRAYTNMVYWDGALLMGATLGCVGVRWADAKGKGWKWVA